MIRTALCLLILATAGCATLSQRADSIQDPAGNLQGDVSRQFVDVLESRAALQDKEIAFEVRVAAPFPEAKAMAGGKRVDYIWLVDADCNPATGQGPLGNDYNVHLWLDETGWHPGFLKVSPVAEKDATAIDLSKFRIEAKGATARLSFPQEYLPNRTFEWRLHAMTDNAPDWKPVTENPVTALAHFGDADLSEAVTPYKCTNCIR